MVKQHPQYKQTDLYFNGKIGKTAYLHQYLNKTSVDVCWIGKVKHFASLNKAETWLKEAGYAK